MCLPLKTISHIPLNVNSLSFLTLGDCSSFYNIVPNPEVSSTLYLIIVECYSSSIVNDSAVHGFELFLDRTKPTQDEAEENPCNFGLYNPSKMMILDVVIL